MKRCSKCGLPETWDTIEFLDDGSCNICAAHNQRKSVDWAARHKELEALIEEHRGRYAYDMILPFSGGKDSCYALWYVMTKFKVKPLVVKYDHGFLRPGNIKNTERAIKRLGCDVLQFTVNWNLVKRTMLESLIRKGDACWACHSHIFSVPMHMALKFGVNLVLWGESNSLHQAYYKDDKEEVDETRFNLLTNLGITASDMQLMVKDSNFDLRDFQFAAYPKSDDLKKQGVRSVCLGSFVPWDTRANVDIIKRELGWMEEELEGGIPGMWEYSKGECGFQAMREYCKWLKRGFTSITQNSAFDVRNGRMTTEEAAVLRASEGKRPASLPIFLDYLGITEDQFNEHVMRSVVYPNEPDFTRGTAAPVHDMADWWREK